MEIPQIPVKQTQKTEQGLEQKTDRELMQSIIDRLNKLVEMSDGEKRQEDYQKMLDTADRMLEVIKKED